MSDPKIVTTPVYESTPEVLEPVLRNSIMAANINPGMEIVDRISSLDGRTYFDPTNRVIIVNDGSNDRILIGYQLNGF